MSSDLGCGFSPHVCHRDKSSKWIKKPMNCPGPFSPKIVTAHTSTVPTLGQTQFVGNRLYGLLIELMSYNECLSLHSAQFSPWTACNPQGNPI
jgi:hypothetical protein